MQIWFTSDHHFFHNNIIKYENRPFGSVEEMNRVMIERWNNVVKPKDLVYYVGDLIFSSKVLASKIISQLNGDKILIKGNHDKGTDFFLKNGFKSVHDELEIQIGEHKVLLCHYPYRQSEEEIAKLDYKVKYQDRRPENKGKWLVHGHVHSAWKIKGNMICCAVENWNYTPVSIDTILQIIEGKFVE